MEARRQKLIDEIKKVISSKTSEKEILQSAIKLIDSFSEQFNWTGFYMMRGDILEVGPYVGLPTPHTKISLDAGICGAAASQKRSVLVDDVNKDPRFLACSLTTRSEIVVPLMDGDVCLGEIDIDSNTPSYFTDDDRLMLERLAGVVVDR